MTNPTPNDSTIAPETRRQILADMRRMWANTRYQTEIELRIQERLKTALSRDVGEVQRSLTDRLREVEVAIGLLDEELARMEA
jgi:hypothetical protein